MAIALSLIAALVYGSSDFFGGLASRRASTIGVVVCSQAMGLLVLAVALLLIGGHPQAPDLVWGAICGIAGAAAIAALYRGLAIGTMGVVSPLSAVLGAAIPMLYGIAIHGERPTWLAYAGIAAALIAVICVSAAGDPPDHTTHAPARRFFGLPAGVPEALIAGIAFGFFFVALAQTRSDAGMYPLLAARVTSIVVLAAGGATFGGIATIGVPRATIPLVLLCGALDMTSNILYVLAAHIGMLSIVAVLTSLYPAATVGLAAIVLRERLRPLQWTGVALALGGALAISTSP